MRWLTLLALAPIVLAASPAAAGEGCEGAYDAASVVQHIFDTADTNRDGSLTRDEYEGAGLQDYGVTFDQSDTDGDGATTLREYLELYEKHHPQVGPADEAEA